MLDEQTRYVALDNGYDVWTRRIGLSPIKMLALNGGPGLTHEYLTPLVQFAKDNHIELIMTDQLGSFFSDQPNDEDLWNIPRFVDEIEQIRRAYNLDQFYLYGHGWGAVLAMEYAIHYSNHVVALIDSNMVGDYPTFVKDINSSRESMDIDDLGYMKAAEVLGHYDDPRYQAILQKILNQHYCRLSSWPTSLTRDLDHINQQVYQTLHGPSLYEVIGRLRYWSIMDELDKLTVPTLVIGGRYDFLKPESLRNFASKLPDSELYICPNGSRLPMYDDPQNYFAAIQAFIRRVENFTNSRIKRAVVSE